MTSPSLKSFGDTSKDKCFEKRLQHTTLSISKRFTVFLSKAGFKCLLLKLTVAHQKKIGLKIQAE